MASKHGASVRLWDWPVRIIHWSLVILLPALWWTAENEDIGLHKQLGHVVIALVVFRLLWGIVGSSTARFAAFVKAPRGVWAYLWSKPDDSASPTIGHNPLGAISVVALLLVLSVQIGTGLIAQDVDGIESGPLTYLVSYDTADAAREWHEFAFNSMLGLVALHVAAVLYYLLVKRDNLIGPMVSGRKMLPAGVTPPVIAAQWRGAVIAAFAGAFAYWISLGAPL